jgi:hypothetical protein
MTANTAFANIFRISFLVATACLSGLVAWAADAKLDIEKLKPGDKLELKVGGEWKSVEYVGKGDTSGSVMVNRPPFPRPVAAAIASLRLPVAASSDAAPVQEKKTTEKKYVEIDPNKLKAGDKLEYNQFGDEWITVEYAGRSKMPTMLMVIRPPVTTRPLPTPITWLRLPGTAGQKAPVDDGKAAAKKLPEIKPEEAPAPIRREWVARTGDFKVEATFLRLEDGKVVLKRVDNGKEISVPLEKLSQADQTIAIDAQSTQNRAAVANAELPKDQKAEEDEVPLAKTNYKEAREIKVPERVEWAYEPIEEPKFSLPRTAHVDLKSKHGDFVRLKRILPLAKDKTAFVVFVDEDPRHNESYPSSVQACSLQSGKVESEKGFAARFEPIDLSTDGSIVLARSTGFFPNARNTLRIYRRQGNMVKPLCAWQPCEPSPDDKAAAAKSDEVKWANLVDNEHVVTMSGDGDLVIWRVPDVTPVYRMSLGWGGTYEFAGDHKYLVVVKDSAIVILSALDGRPVGKIKGNPTGFSSSVLGISDSGTKLAVVQGNRFFVWDLKTREMTRDFSVEGAGWSLEWLDDNHLLSGGTVIDIERRIPIFSSTVEAYQVEGGRVWYVESSQLKVAEVPDQQLLNRAAKLNPDDLLVLRPGISVAIDLQVGGQPEEIERTRKAIAARLQANDMKVDAESKVKLVGTLQPGKTETVRYRTFGVGGTAETQVTTQVLSLSFQVNGETVWQQTQSTWVPSLVSLKEGETIEQAVARDVEKQNQGMTASRLGQIELPKYLSRKLDATSVPAK